MSLTAALRGFVVLLCCFSVVKSQTDWKVKYYQTEICADKGSTVVILCSYDFPVMLNRVSTTVKKSFWFIRTEGEPVDLREDPEYKDRVTYSSSPKSCYLIISGVRESDSAVYKFMFITNHQTGRYIGEPGVRLTVRDLQVLLVSTSVQQEDSDVQLKCFIRCDPKGLEEYVWFINGEETRSRIQSETSQTFLYRSWNSSTDRISCSLRSSKTDQSPEVYAPRTPTVSLDPPTEILEGRSVTLTCSSDANPAAKFNWFKKMKSSVKILSQGPQFVFDSIQSTDSGDYYCKVQNYLGLKISDFKLEVKYAPKNISVSVNPPEILEGSSVTLTCSSDANPAANYTWFKAKNRLNAANVYHLPSININDSGIYRCKSENKHGWINSSVHIDVLCSVGLAAACSIPAVLLTLIFLAVLFLKIFRRRSSGPLVIRSQDKDAQNREGSDREDPTSRHPAEDETEIQYATVTFTKRQEDPLYSNIEPVKAKRRRDAHEDKEDVVYSLVGPSRSPAD
ncbi:B-cell receptor CD22 isoform X3 [Oryzias melastigma]|uniref:B-cell receptor CD22 isoform X3 n=1 Tax=Oryzias melastigma TaxID=30732 RepID=UPI00168D485E|nr:B-cell receptor CD22 isoform X3 [Oryzias melastigma]